MGNSELYAVNSIKSYTRAAVEGGPTQMRPGGLSLLILKLSLLILKLSPGSH